MATNPYANVTEIVFQNNRFPLNGASVEEVLSLLNVPENADLEVVGVALLITEKSGTKGADEVNQDLAARLAETFGAETIKGARMKLHRASNGKWVPKIPGFTLDEVAYLIDKDVELAEEMTDEQVEIARQALEARDAEIQAEKEAAAQREVDEILADSGLNFTYDQLVCLQKALDAVKR